MATPISSTLLPLLLLSVAAAAAAGSQGGRGVQRRVILADGSLEPEAAANPDAAHSLSEEDGAERELSAAAYEAGGRRAVSLSRQPASGTNASSQAANGTNASSQANGTNATAGGAPQGQGPSHHSLVTGAAFLVLTIIISSFLAVAARAKLPAAPEDKQPPLWVFTMLLCSYALLIPGITLVLFSFDLVVVFEGHQINLASVLGKPGAIAESVLSLAKMLLDTGGILGAVLLIVYAIVVPIVKLTFLTLGECWRVSKDPTLVLASQTCIGVVQTISKWACPDMFAYILVLYLFRDLSRRSSIIGGPSHLDMGFICFSGFCVCSSFSALAIRPPPDPPGTSAAPKAPPLALRCCGVRGVFFVAASLAVVFAVLLRVGITLPCMGLRMDTDLLLEPKGPLPASLKPLLDGLDLSKEVNADVSLWDCLGSLLAWAAAGELTCAFAFLMLGGFVVAMAALDMLALVAAAYDLRARALPGTKAGGPSSALLVARTLHHVSMLDVFLMGVVVVCLAGNAYRDKGIEFILEPGLLVLLFAEAYHHVAYHLVTRVADYVAQEEGKASS